MSNRISEKSAVKQNILTYLNAKNISQYQCYKDTGITRGVLSQDNGISEENLIKFITTYKDISPDWLITGSGEMLRRDVIAHSDGTNMLITPIHKPVYTEKKLEEQFIPFLAFDASAGFAQLEYAPEHVIGQIAIPNMPPCDGAVQVVGDSMYPLLKSGDIVAYRIIHDISNIHFGDMYLVCINEDGDTYISVKWIKKHPSDPNKVVLISYNEHYAPRDVELRHIIRLALIKFSIRYNNMG